jgi:trehalose utilization protein
VHLVGFIKNIVNYIKAQRLAWFGHVHRMADNSMVKKSIRRAQVKVGLINLCKGLFSLNARIYYKLKSGT